MDRTRRHLCDLSKNVIERTLPAQSTKLALKRGAECTSSTSEMRPLQARASLTQPTPRVKRSWPPLAVLKELQHIPGVGPSIAVDLYDLHIRSVADLKGQSPEALYERLCTLRGCRIDRCMLYVFRCAIYFANTKKPDPARLQWWIWKDAK